uniref:DUF4082 domain-containing protein n=1 Tax=Eiseniibacteriota bacterium TaxID=2212470 RepID=A0A832I353_UNCEI
MCAALALTFALAGAAFAQNPIVAENALPGNPASEWEVSGAGDPSIQGFATDISVNRGGTIGFKVSTDAAQFEIRIYRLGWYGGDGARLVATIGPLAGAVQAVPPPDPTTGLVDCGAWAQSAAWAVPGGAVSGIYLARLVRLDTQGASHVVFVVRDDASTSDLLFKTSDATWQAYNVFGGNSLYVGTTSYPGGHATHVSYNRPFVTRAGGGGGGASEDWLFNAEYPMVRWLEANGYDVTYTTDVDADRHGALIANHRVFLSVGHDEYWSAAQRAHVEAARDAGTHLAFLSGNEVYWKTRWETSPVTGDPYRTLVCYKEGTLGENACGGKCDPLPNVWTGLWRDGQAFSPPADGHAPENALTGQISWGLGEAALQVPAAFRDHRFWRNTSVAALGAGQTATLGARILGYEYDYEQWEAFYPAGRVTLSGTSVGGNLHRLSLYRAPSGALVFGAGTVQWSWGLDATHDRGSDAPVQAIRQATVNLLADMGAQSATLQPGLVAAVASNDTQAPASAITAPLDGATVPGGVAVAVSGTASDAGGGIVARVQVSTDGGATWADATGGAAWTYTWVPAAAGSASLRVRAVDDLGNLETPGAGITVSVTEAQCPCNVFASGETPAYPDNNDGQPIEIGMKFRTTVDGLVTGVRYHKGAAWTTGTRVGHLWSAAGVQLAEVTFAGETASGWQQMLFTTPVAVTAGETYVVSVHSSSGHYGYTTSYFGAALERGRLIAIANGDASGPNGVYRYGASGFPTSTYNASNYWVDVVFEDDDTVAPVVLSTSPAAGATGVAPFAHVTATFSEALDPATVSGATFELRDALAAAVPATVTWDAPTRTATLVPGVALDHLATYTATLRGGASAPRLQDPAGNPLAADVSWSFTTAAPDLSPPVVSGTQPAPGATGVPTTSAVDVVFDEAMSPATINGSTLELRDPLNALVPTTVAYNIYMHTATVTPSAPLAANTTYTLTVKGGGADPRVKDASGNPMAADHVLTFTTGSAFGCPCTVFQPGDAPAQADVTDGQALELGMKFRASVSGYATGVRFWKGPLNTGTHVGSLWTSAGALLARTTFTGETASGWQQASFPSPVALTANTTYIVSYHSPSYFSVNTQYFGAPVVNGPLTALADGADGANGVFLYTTTPAFPTQSGNSPYHMSNYWVDVVFETEVGPDVTPPSVTATVPAHGASGVAVGANVTATFSEAIDSATLDGTTFTLRAGADPPLAASVTWNAGTLTATLDPAAPLAYSTTYTARLAGGGADPRVKDVAGNALAADVTWSFTTAAAPPPPPDEGPGGPLLVIATAADPFSRYYAEILRCEGLNAFRVRDLSLVTPAVLDSHEIAILAPAALSPAQVTMLETWVTAGGSLIAVRPDTQLATLLGLAPAGGTLANRYLLVNTAAPPGQGIVGQTIQYHDTADLWTLAGATAVATLYSDATTPTAYPAVTLRSVGTHGGSAAAFTYDLARSIVYTRQGNPAWAGQERDGTPPIRSNDLFYGNAAGDPQPDWVDLTKVAIPQADEQQRLLANLILHTAPGGLPIPRFWYFPSGKKAVVIHTGDNHGSSGTPVRFDANLAQSPGGCSVPDWECVRSTSYLYAGAPLTDAQVQSYQAQGFEIGIHLNTGCADWTPASLAQNWSDQFGAAQALYPSLAPQTTHRTHCIAWSDWTSQAALQAARGVRLDVNYYYWPPAWVQNRPGLFTGSAMPMRYAALDGTMIDCYQAATQMTDESGQSYPFTVNTLLDRALGPDGYYGAFCTNIHLDGSSETINQQVVQSALDRGVPVVSAAQMLAWLDGRNASTFQNLTWDGAHLAFSIAVGAGANNLRAMLPAQRGAATLQALTRDGAPVTYATETIKGVAYAVFPAAAGDYAATYEEDVTPPAISSVTATPAADGTALIQWTTDEPSDSRVDYGTDPGSLASQATNPALVTAHAVTLTGLAANTTYHFRVTSADAAANTATSPAPPQAPASFATPAGPCAADRLAADFAAGTAVTTAVGARDGDGEVSLVPAYGTEFPGAALPADWSSANGAPWNGGTPVVAGGVLSVNGCIAGTNSAYGPGASVEFVANFPAEPYAHVGFVDDLAFSGPWALVSTGPAGDGIYARSNLNTAGIALAGATLGAPHRYRIDWTGSSFVFWVDGVQRATIPQTEGGDMLVAASDLNQNATALAVDWVRVSPYGSPGEFLSRVHDAGQSVNWGAATWTAEVPSGAGLKVSVRTGATPVPDGSWSPFAPLAGSGASVGAYARYLQYRVAMTSSDGRVSPRLDEVEIACTTGPDVSPPVITSLAATSTGDGSGATVTWTTDEPATSVVDYGTDPGALTQQVASGALVTSHSVALTGLTPGTLHHYRVTSVDAASNVATAPAPPAPPATFTTGTPPVVPCRADSLAADFAAGVHAGTHVAETADGEVMLAPKAVAEFSGGALPEGWASVAYGAGGAATLTGSAIQLDGWYVRTDSLTYAPGRSLEFVATFDAVAAGQHAGFGNTLNESPWAIFSTKAGGDLYARTAGNAGSVESPGLGTAYLGAPHRFRIDWNATNVVFWIDGVQVATLANEVPGPLRPIASDGPVGGQPFVVHWMRMTPHATSGTFLSRVLDAGSVANWGAATWAATVPTGTGLALSARTGPTPTPDGSWSAFATLAAPGASVGATARYLQYRAEFSTADPAATPELRSFGVACEAAPDLVPPVISAVAVSPAQTSATVTWTTDEPATSVVDYGASAGALTQQVSSGALVTSHSLEITGLAAATTYHFRVGSTDASANASADPAPPGTRTFTTHAPACFTDAVAGDFAAGAHVGTAVSETADGEVILAPAVHNEFFGSALSSDWTSVRWADGAPGGATVAGGALTADGGRVTPLATTGHAAGRTLEFVATFGAAGAEARHQHVGFGSGDNSSGATGMYGSPGVAWVMFSTHNTGTQLYARINNPDNAGDNADVALGASYLGAAHRYRIEWGSSTVIFYVDGVQVAQRSAAIARDMRPGISDWDGAGFERTLAVDWIRMTPHAAAGEFTSRVYDSGGIATWERLTWTADAPAGTALAMAVRRGDTPSPDSSWSAFQPVASSGDIVGGTSRYVQVRAQLSSSDPAATPALRDVSLACTVCTETTPPAAIANLVATGTGNAGGGRAHVRLTWSGVEAGHTVAVYRMGFGDHPLYRTTHGGVPAVPATPAAALAAGWTPTGVTASGGLDAAPSRDLWHYVAFVTNPCGVLSPPSNRAGGTLNYVLGDVSDGSAVCAGGGEAGDALVGTADLSALGAEYGDTFPDSDPRVCLDVGPTVDRDPRSMPVPDGVLGFEDLVIYALNYGIPLAAPQAAASIPRAGARAAERDELIVMAPPAVRAGERFQAVLRFVGTGAVRALSAALAWNAAVAEVEGFEAGAMLLAAGGVALSPRPGTVDAAVLGATGPGLAGDGELAVVTFRARADGEPAVRLAEAKARDAANQPVALGAPARPRPAPPATTALGAVFPNPFRGTLNVSFSLAREARVRVTVFDLAGRVVRRVEDGPRPAGFHVVTWDGRAETGRAAPSGVYVVRFESGEIVQTRRVQLIR